MKLKKFLPFLVIGGLLSASVAYATVLQPFQGGTGISSSTATGNCLQVLQPSTTSSLLYALGSCGSGGGGVGTSSVLTAGTVPVATASGTIANASSGANAFIPFLNTTLNIPANFATAGCNGSSTLTDFGACVNALYVSQSSTGFSYVGIQIPNIKVTRAQWTTPINFNIAGLSPSLFAPSGAELHYGGTGTAITWNAVDSGGHIKTQNYGFSLYGSSTAITGGLINNATTTGIVCGGSNGCVGVNFHDLSINGFGTDLETKNNTYLDTFDHLALSGWNGGVGYSVKIDPASNSGESLEFHENSITDGGNSTGTKGFFVSDNATADLKITGGSFDDAQLYIGIANAVTVDTVHFENADYPQYPGYAYIYATSSAASTLTLTSNIFDQDSNAASSTPPQFVEQGVGTLVAIGNYFDKYGTVTVPIAIDNSIAGVTPQETYIGNQNQNTAYTLLSTANYAQAGGIASVGNLPISTITYTNTGQFGGAGIQLSGPLSLGAFGGTYFTQQNLSTSGATNGGLSINQTSATGTYMSTVISTDYASSSLSLGLNKVIVTNNNLVDGGGNKYSTSTTSINGTPSASFQIIGDNIGITSTVSGATTTFKFATTSISQFVNNSGYVTSTGSLAASTTAVGFLAPTGTGNYSITGLGFKPSRVTIKVTVAGHGASGGSFTYSEGTVIAPSTSTVTVWGENDSNNGFSNGTSTTNIINLTANQGTSATTATFTSFDASGFTINLSAYGGSYSYLYYAYK